VTFEKKTYFALKNVVTFWKSVLYLILYGI